MATPSTGAANSDVLLNDVPASGRTRPPKARAFGALRSKQGRSAG
jgi:hypothetical protein